MCCSFGGARERFLLKGGGGGGEGCHREVLLLREGTVPKRGYC